MVVNKLSRRQQPCLTRSRVVLRGESGEGDVGKRGRRGASPHLDLSEGICTCSSRLQPRRDGFQESSEDEVGGTIVLFLALLKLSKTLVESKEGLENIQAKLGEGRVG